MLCQPLVSVQFASCSTHGQILHVPNLPDNYLWLLLNIQALVYPFAKTYKLQVTLTCTICSPEVLTWESQGERILEDDCMALLGLVSPWELTPWMHAERATQQSSLLKASSLS